jgi:hypothetical protein
VLLNYNCHFSLTIFCIYYSRLLINKGPQSQSGHWSRGKSLASAWNRTSSIQPIAHYYSDWAIPAHRLPITSCTNLSHFIKSSLAICHVNAKLKAKVLEILSFPIIRIYLVNDHMSLIFIPVCQINASSSLPIGVLRSRRAELNCMVTHPTLTYHHVLSLVSLLSNTLLPFQHAFHCAFLEYSWCMCVWIS